MQYSDRPGEARETARRALAVYARSPNYANNLRRLGFTDDDIEPVSDRFVDALVAWGDVDAIAHASRPTSMPVRTTCACRSSLRPVTVPRDDWRELAPALVA